MSTDFETISEADRKASAAEESGRGKQWPPVAAFAVSVTALRISIGFVYIWFGALKAAGVTPVKDVVVAATPWPDPAWFVPALGWLEVALGVAFLVIRLAPRVVAVVFVAHMVSTGSVLVFAPSMAFQHDNPLLLTTVGEFVVKNVVLFLAGIATVLWELRRQKNSWQPEVVRDQRRRDREDTRSDRAA